MGDVIHVDFAQEHQKREIASEPFYIGNLPVYPYSEPKIEFTLEDGTTFDLDLDDTFDDMFDWSGAKTPEDFPLPQTEYTLFGWSVRVWDHQVKTWYTLPDFYQSEAAALAVAEAYLLAIDFNPHNDNEWWD